MPKENQPILLTGVHGQVGSQLLPLLQAFGPVAAPVRGELDLTDAEAIRGYVRRVQPRWIVNPAAYTAVDKAEVERDLAYAVNATAPRVFGEEAAALGIPMLHFSTDYVFDGTGTAPWKETDETGPLGIYGASKLEGEKGLKESKAVHLIFRTSWVYGGTGNNFLRTILRLAGERDEMKIVADQHGAPTWSRDLARMAASVVARSEQQAAEQGGRASDVLEPLSGVYHACNGGFTTWFGFAEEFLRLAQMSSPEKRFAQLLPITTAEYPTPARRPGNSRMNCEKLMRALDYELPSWQDSVSSVMAELLETQGLAAAAYGA